MTFPNKSTTFFKKKIYQKKLLMSVYIESTFSIYKNNYYGIFVTLLRTTVLWNSCLSSIKDNYNKIMEYERNLSS